MIGNLNCMDDSGRGRLVCMSCLSDAALPGYVRKLNLHGWLRSRKIGLYVLPVRHGTSRLSSVPGAPCASTSPGARIPNVRRNVEWLKLWFIQAMPLLVEPVEWDPVLLRNISRQVEHMHMICIVFPCIYRVYAWYIQRIFLVYVDITVYTMYIPCIYMVYTWYIPSICIHHCIYHVYT